MYPLCSGQGVKLTVGLQEYRDSPAASKLCKFRHLEHQVGLPGLAESTVSDPAISFMFIKPQDKLSINSVRDRRK